MRKKYYWIRVKGDFCSLCGAKLEDTLFGEFCSDKKCSYFDGRAYLSKDEVEKYKDFVVI